MQNILNIYQFANVNGNDVAALFDKGKIIVQIFAQNAIIDIFSMKWSFSLFEIAFTQAKKISCESPHHLNDIKN